MRRASLAVALLLAGPSTGAVSSAGTLPALCSQGVFVVAGDPLVPGRALETPDLVSLEGSTLQIASGALAEVTLRPTRRGTVLRGRLIRNGPAAASWSLLQALVDFASGGSSHAPKPPRIKALLDPECKVMTGKLRGRGLRREFVATAVYGEPVCGTIAGLPCAEGSFCELPPDTCQSADLAGVCVPRDVACTQQWEPVCGCDGVTYGNDCMRALAGVQKSHDGSCETAPE